MGAGAALGWRDRGLTDTAAKGLGVGFTALAGRIPGRGRPLESFVELMCATGARRFDAHRARKPICRHNVRPEENHVWHRGRLMRGCPLVLRFTQ